MLKKYFCSICNAEFDDQHTYASHKKWKHRKDKNFYCKKCGKHFKEECGIAIHDKFCNIISKICPICKKKFIINNSRKIERKKKFCSRSCRNRSRKLSKQTKDKISKKAIQNIEKYGVIRVKTRRNKIEVIIEEYLNKNGLLDSFVSQYKFQNDVLKKFKKSNTLFFDFYFKDKKINLELDGSQHFEEQRMRQDKMRDQALTKLGIFVYRVKYSKLHIVLSLINEFINFYKNYNGDLTNSGMRYSN